MEEGSEWLQSFHSQYRTRTLRNLALRDPKEPARAITCVNTGRAATHANQEEATEVFVICCVDFTIEIKLDQHAILT